MRIIQEILPTIILSRTPVHTGLGQAFIRPITANSTAAAEAGTALAPALDSGPALALAVRSMGCSAGPRTATVFAWRPHCMRSDLADRTSSQLELLDSVPVRCTLPWPPVPLHAHPCPLKMRR
jgi:hypothetical protein